MRDAEVVCRQLGCGAAVKVTKSKDADPSGLFGPPFYSPSRFGSGSGPIWMADVSCSGSESSLKECGSGRQRELDCNHAEDAGVICSGGVRLVGGANLCSGRVEKPNCSHENDVGLVCSGHRSLRLVGGGADCAGRLEVFHRGSWGTVCDDSWDLEDAQVACRQLQCGTALSVPLPFPLRPATGPIWLDEVGCVGNETSLWECPTAEWGQTDCGHKQDVTVLCSEYKQLRLRQGDDTRVCSGLAEVFYNTTWGSVCGNEMTQDTATVIYRQLGCGDSEKFEQITTSLPSGSPFWIDNIKCGVHDESLWQCPSSPWGENDCSNTETAKITCTGPKEEIIEQTQVLQCPGEFTVPALQYPRMPERRMISKLPSSQLRLVGPSNCSGRVEVWFLGSWGTVCDDSWDMREAQVVCRQLGCGEALRVEGKATVGRGNGTIWLDEVNCTGDELHLWDCCRSPLNQSDCSHKEDAGVTCTGIPANYAPSSSESESTLSPPSLNIPAVAFVVLGALLFLLLVVLGVLVSQNRGLRRGHSLGDQALLHEAVYEEIELKHARIGTYSAPKRGSVLYEDPPSGYEDVGDSEGHSLSGELGDAAENYDDVNSADQNPGGAEGGLGREDAPEHYDDVITPDQHPYSVEGELLKGDAPEHYDDVITEEQSPGDHVTEDTEQNYDDAVTLHWSQEGESVLAPEGPPAPDGMDYDDVGEESLEGGGVF
ncbi:hypothetical protein AGOR_G00196810 [Albula goreensis]|uniref:SRCR domain-containing protein n=1 Tax=Albula goreensis TaxID=1534307 RepID=A0A8T3CN23_9TELE|nr:hypothetical protein AGOR_G00196810 [Albula goreensis]